MADVNTQLVPNTQTTTLPPSNPLVGQGFNVDTRLGAGGATEYFNKETGQGYSTPDALAQAVQPFAPNVNASNVFDVLKQGVQPVKVDLPSEIPAKTLENPTSQSDVNSALAQNNAIAQQYAQSFNPTADMTQAMTDVNNSKAALRNFDTSLQGGIQQIMKQPIPMAFQTGQEAALTRDAAFTRSSLADTLSAYSDTLSALQSRQQALQQGLQAQMQNGQFNVNTAMQLQQNQQQQAELQYQHEQAARQFAVQYNVQSPVYSADGGKTLINTQTGKAYSNPQDFFNDFGFKSWAEVPPDFIQKTLITNEQKNADRSYALQKDQFDFSKTESDRNFGLQQDQFNYSKVSGDRSYALQQAQQALDVSKFDFTKTHSGQVVGTGQYDDNGNEIKGVFDGQTMRAIGGAGADIASQYQDGTNGGQCGTFAESIDNIGTPGNTVGNTLAQKQATVDKYGVSVQQWQQEGAQAGDVLIENYGKSGHVATVISNNGDGTVTVKESNFGLDGKIGTRTIPVNDPKIYGVLRGTLKGDTSQAQTSGTTTNTNARLDAYASQYASTGAIPTGMPQQLFGKVAQAAKELPKASGTIVDVNTGIKPSKMSDAQMQGISSLYDIVNNQLPILMDRYGKIDKSIVGKIGSKVYTTQDRQDFRTAKQEIINLLVKARSGSQVSDQEYERYSKMLPNETSLTGSSNSINSLYNELSNTLNNQLKNNGVSIYGYSKVQVNGQTYKVGDILNNGNQKARVNPDGSLTAVQ